MKKILICFLILFSAAAIAYGNEPSFRVEIKVDEKSLATLSTSEKNEGTFIVLTQITNVSDKAKSFGYSCGYGDLWVSDNLAVAPVSRCRKNYPQTILLEPGKSYDRSLDLAFFKEAVPGPLTFKLGFKQASGSKEIVWSSQVTITVNKDMLRDPYTHQGPHKIVIGKEIQSWDEIPFEVRRLMLREGARNIEFSDKEKALLSDEERKILKKYE